MNAPGYCLYFISIMGELVEEDKYDYAEIANQVFAPIFEPIAQLLLRETSVCAGKLLDVGCGVGHLGLTVLKHCAFSATFVDLHPLAVQLCAEKALEWQLQDLVAEIVRADVHDLPFAGNSFDLVISRGSLGLWKNPGRAFAEIYRVLAPGGKTFIGYGLGNKQTKAQVSKLMKQRNPDWPDSIKRKQNWLSTEEYCDLFKQNAWPYRVYENEDEGRWFILEKPGEQ